MNLPFQAVIMSINPRVRWNASDNQEKSWVEITHTYDEVFTSCAEDLRAVPIEPLELPLAPKCADALKTIQVQPKMDQIAGPFIVPFPIPPFVKKRLVFSNCKTIADKWGVNTDGPKLGRNPIKGFLELSDRLESLNLSGQLGQPLSNAPPSPRNTFARLGELMGQIGLSVLGDDGQLPYQRKIDIPVPRCMRSDGKGPRCPNPNCTECLVFFELDARFAYGGIGCCVPDCLECRANRPPSIESSDDESSSSDTLCPDSEEKSEDVPVKHPEEGMTYSELIEKYGGNHPPCLTCGTDVRHAFDEPDPVDYAIAMESAARECNSCSWYKAVKTVRYPVTNEGTQTSHYSADVPLFPTPDPKKPGPHVINVRPIKTMPYYAVLQAGILAIDAQLTLIRTASHGPQCRCTQHCYWQGNEAAEIFGRRRYDLTYFLDNPPSNPELQEKLDRKVTLSADHDYLRLPGILQQLRSKAQLEQVLRDYLDQYPESESTGVDHAILPELTDKKGWAQVVSCDPNRFGGNIIPLGRTLPCIQKYGNVWEEVPEEVAYRRHYAGPAEINSDRLFPKYTDNYKPSPRMLKEHPEYFPYMNVPEEEHILTANLADAMKEYQGPDIPDSWKKVDRGIEEETLEDIFLRKSNKLGIFPDH